MLLVCSVFSLQATAQVTLSGQVRTRTEVRDGQGAPLSIGAPPAFFTSQRTRLSVGYNADRLKLGITAQDVRLWGQDVSTINRTTTADLNGLLLHEAWAELGLTDTVIKNKTLSLKIGRQELLYDDQRLLGNLDWLQQGRRHDAALMKFESIQWTLHMAAAFSQNKEGASGTLYNNTPPGAYAATTNGGSMYKSLAFLYAARKLEKGHASFLFLSDAFSGYHSDPVTSAKVYDSTLWRRATTGFYFTNSFNRVLLTASAYYQFGHTAAGQPLQAELVSLAAHYAFSKMLSSGAGVDYYSGGTSGTTSNAFDPLYGTPHKFAGLMDYFYAVNAFGKNGLVDYSLKSRYRPTDRLVVTADFHQFNSAAGVTGFTTKNLGQEIDLVGTYALTKQIGFEGGYARYFTTPLLTAAAVKNIPNAKPSANWAYLMISVKPEFLFK